VKTESKTCDDAPKPEHTNVTAAKTSEKLPRFAYSMRETAEILGVSYITVHRLLKRGKLRASNAIRNKIIPKTEIDRFLRESITEDAA
jgi:excisionase family DNA binding protein